MPHEKRVEFGIGSGGGGPIRNGNDAAIIFGAGQLFEVVTVDGNDDPLLFIR
jgi:hypothetical protein